jgi:hypothetical protein
MTQEFRTLGHILGAEFTAKPNSCSQIFPERVICLKRQNCDFGYGESFFLWIRNCMQGLRVSPAFFQGLYSASGWPDLFFQAAMCSIFLSLLPVAFLASSRS